MTAVLEHVFAGLIEHEELREIESDEPTQYAFLPSTQPARRPELDPFEDLLSPQTLLDQYLILSELGRGGAGVVYAALDFHLEREVAIKVLRPELGDADEQVERFQIEARAAARLKHPGIVGVHRIGEFKGRHYLVMDLVQGRSLAAHMRSEGSLENHQAAWICEQLAWALAYAHDQQILHRDLKPGNVLLRPTGEPVLTDFGLAKDIRQDAISPTINGQVIGTPAYMSPEQAGGDLARVDQRGDIYGLGTILYEMLCGAPPFQEETLLGTLAQVTSATPARPLRELCSEVDRALEIICLKCIEKDPRLRYQSAQALADDLDRYLRNESILARPPLIPTGLRRWSQEHRTWLQALLALLIFALGWAAHSAF